MSVLIRGVAGVAFVSFCLGLAGIARGQCPEFEANYTDAEFSGGAYVLQAGFAESEIAAVQYQLTAQDFPIKLNLVEVIVAQATTNQTTTTQWSILVWAGPPNTGTLIGTFSSDDVILPHIVLPAGPPTGVNVQFFVDPGDPEQIIIPANASNSFTVGFRIDEHNNQTQNPCIVAPPSNSNAFPTTDTGGLQFPTRNWLWAVDCGILGCNAGWTKFSQLGLCQPSGDWVMRAYWESLNCSGGDPGACCLPNGQCLAVTQSECDTLNGTFHGEGSTCGQVQCPQPTQACCIELTGGCLDLDPADCIGIGGIPGGVGTSCATFTCFPEGACCLPDGSCIGPVSPEDCAAQGGIFQGDGTSCATANCPEPTGACCFSSGFCLVLTEDECVNQAGGTWAGPGSTCVDADQNGTADACEETPCIADLNGDGQLTGVDVGIFLNSYANQLPPGDINGDGAWNGIDVGVFLSAYSQGC